MTSDSDSDKKATKKEKEIIDMLDCLQRNVARLHRSQANSQETIEKIVDKAVNGISQDFRDLRRSIMASKSGSGLF